MNHAAPPHVEAILAEGGAGTAGPTVLKTPPCPQ